MAFDIVYAAVLNKSFSTESIIQGQRHANVKVRTVAWREGSSYPEFRWESTFLRKLLAFHTMFVASHLCADVIEVQFRRLQCIVGDIYELDFEELVSCVSHCVSESELS